MPIYRYVGKPALSDCRAQKLQAQLQRIFPQLLRVDTHHVYFIKTQEAITAPIQKECMELLQAEIWDAFSFDNPDPEYEYAPGVLNLSTDSAPYTKTVSPVMPGSHAVIYPILVVPRLGTQSPWSSKALEIFQACHLDSICNLESGILYRLYAESLPSLSTKAALATLLHDRMTESVVEDFRTLDHFFSHDLPLTATVINVLSHGKKALSLANQSLGLALDTEEIAYLHKQFKKQKRNPSDAELMMFAQINSEHCRHKVFRSNWVIDGCKQPHTLFDMIKNTYAQNPQGVLSAYQDNGAVFSQSRITHFDKDTGSHVYGYQDRDSAIVIKAETHNHPTAISPFAGAATGAGGEIRDEGAVGRGGYSKAGFSGFSVSDLNIPGYRFPWEAKGETPFGMASALDIMQEAPIGACAFNNEFGRPNLLGYFRTYQRKTHQTHISYGYHKPIMIAGGLGRIRSEHIAKSPLPIGAKLIVLGGAAMRIGIGGGSASSLVAGSQDAALDFASVQRADPQMQRRCQEVILACTGMGEKNVILAIHDVGAGGLSCAIPELLAQAKVGGYINLRDIPCGDPSLSPMEIWCNEAQERYVLAIVAEDLPVFRNLAERERCPFAVIGETTAQQALRVIDPHFQNVPIDLPLSLLFSESSKRVIKTTRPVGQSPKIQRTRVFPTDLLDCAERILQLPAVSDKSFLITIGDRTVGGQVARDQMVGPWQVPVSDVAVTACDFTGYKGEAMALGERPTLAPFSKVAAVRMALGEAITNISAAYIGKNLSLIKLSANWMADVDSKGEATGLYDAVAEIGLKLCPDLGICIPVGKDSLSMQTKWQVQGEARRVIAPLSLVVSAFAPVIDIRKTCTPELKKHIGESCLILIDLGGGNRNLGGSALAQVYNLSNSAVPDIEDSQILSRFFEAIQTLHARNLVAAYHDRSDGGLFVTLCEMAFAAQVGLKIALDQAGANPLEALFSESLGVVIQIRCKDRESVRKILKTAHLDHYSHEIGTLTTDDTLSFSYANQPVLQQSRLHFRLLWSGLSHKMQTLRDNPICAKQAFDALSDSEDTGLHAHLTFDRQKDIAAPFIQKGVRPRVAILREQGTNGHVEMAAAFDKAGFAATDVHMMDLLEKRFFLNDFVGLVFPGGFSYGDVLGAGRGWAACILKNLYLKACFTQFFARTDTFTFGACNGCQVLSQLKALIPGTEDWPNFIGNNSEQFESRLSLLEVQPSPSLFFQGMAGSRICVPVAHREGKVAFKNDGQAQSVFDSQAVVACYVDYKGRKTEKYPYNPNGSFQGIAGLTSKDGRVTILMPHTERVFRTVQHAWHPDSWQEDAPCMRIFRNARVWIG